MSYEVICFILALVICIALIFLVIWNVIAFDDLKTDYKNPIDLCQTLNPLVLPEYIIHAFLMAMFLFGGYWIVFLLNVPLLCYHIYRYANRPLISGPGIYDATEIMNTSELNRCQREGWVKLAFFLISFFIYLYRSKMKSEKLKSLLERLKDGERKSKLRNENLLADFGKVTEASSDLERKADKLRNVKKRYESYIDNVYPDWKGNIELMRTAARLTSEESDGKQRTKPAAKRSIQNKYLDEMGNVSQIENQDSILQSSPKHKDFSPILHDGRLSRNHALSNHVERPMRRFEHSPDLGNGSRLNQSSFRQNYELKQEWNDLRQELETHTLPLPYHASSDSRPFAGHCRPESKPHNRESSQHYSENHNFASMHQNSDPRKNHPRSHGRELDPWNRVSPEHNEINVAPDRMYEKISNLPQINQAADISKYTILPQALALSPDGKLVLLPMAFSPGMQMAASGLSFNASQVATDCGRSEYTVPKGQSPLINQSRDDGKANTKVSPSFVTSSGMEMPLQNNEERLDTRANGRASQSSVKINGIADASKMPLHIKNGVIDRRDMHAEQSTEVMPLDRKLFNGDDTKNADSRERCDNVETDGYDKSFIAVEGARCSDTDDLMAGVTENERDIKFNENDYKRLEKKRSCDDVANGTVLNKSVLEMGREKGRRLGESSADENKINDRVLYSEAEVVIDEPRFQVEARIDDAMDVREVANTYEKQVHDEGNHFDLIERNREMQRKSSIQFENSSGNISEDGESLPNNSKNEAEKPTRPSLQRNILKDDSREVHVSEAGSQLDVYPTGNSLPESKPSILLAENTIPSDARNPSPPQPEVRSSSSRSSVTSPAKVASEKYSCLDINDLSYLLEEIENRMGIAPKGEFYSRLFNESPKEMINDIKATVASSGTLEDLKTCDLCSVAALEISERIKESGHGCILKSDFKLKSIKTITDVRQALNPGFNDLWEYVFNHIELLVGNNVFQSIVACQKFSYLLAPGNQEMQIQMEVALQRTLDVYEGDDEDEGEEDIVENKLIEEEVSEVQYSETNDKSYKDSNTEDSKPYQETNFDTKKLLHSKKSEEALGNKTNDNAVDDLSLDLGSISNDDDDDDDTFDSTEFTTRKDEDKNSVNDERSKEDVDEDEASDAESLEESNEELPDEQEYSSKDQTDKQDTNPKSEQPSNSQLTYEDSDDELDDMLSSSLAQSRSKNMFNMMKKRGDGNGSTKQENSMKKPLSTFSTNNKPTVDKVESWEGDEENQATFSPRSDVLSPPNNAKNFWENSDSDEQDSEQLKISGANNLSVGGKNNNDDDFDFDFYN
eukprot:gene20463-22479_t